MFKNSKTKEYIFAGISLILVFLGINHIKEIFYFITSLISLISPFLIGGVLAFIVNIPMKKIECMLFKKAKKVIFKKIRRILAYIITVLIILLIFSLVVFVVVPQLKDAFKSLSRQIPEAYEGFKKFLNSYGINIPFITEWLNKQNLDWNKIFESFKTTASLSTFGFLQTGFDAVTRMISSIATFFIGIVVSIYILFQKERLSVISKKLLYALFPKKAAEKTKKLVLLTAHTFSSFLTGQCLEALILGSMFIVAMLLLRLPYAFLIGLLISVCALIPLVGSFIACAIGIILMAIVSPLKVIIFVVMFLVLQQIEGQLIYPHVVGKSIGLPGIFVLFSVIIGGRLFGAPGILLCIPTCSLIYTLAREFINKKLEEKNLQV